MPLSYIMSSTTVVQSYQDPIYWLTSSAATKQVLTVSKSDVKIWRSLEVPPSRYLTSYRSELEGIQLTLQAINETAVTDGIEQYVNNMRVQEIDKQLVTSLSNFIYYVTNSARG